MAVRTRSGDPIAVYYVYSLVGAACFALFFTVHLIYQSSVVGLTPFDMVLVGTVMEVSCFVFEVPTGIVADLYSRRLSVVVGVAVMGCSYLLQASVPQLWAVLASQVVWGLGYTFTSGAHQAWIIDEIGEAAAGPVLLRSTQAMLVGGLIGTVGAAGLGVVTVPLPMVVSGLGMLALAVGLAFVMPESARDSRSTGERPTWSHVWGTARDGLALARRRPVVRIVVLACLVTGLGSEAYDRLSTPSVLERFRFPSVFGHDDPVVWFGASAVVAMLLGLLAAETLARRRPSAMTSGAPVRLLAGLSAVDVIALVVFAVSGNLWLAFVMMWLRSVAQTIIEPVEIAWLGRHLDPGSRATVLSFTGQANAVGQVVGGPVLGAVGSAVSITAALLSSAVVLAMTVVVWVLPAGGSPQLARREGTAR